ncbi:MAG: sensor histidine kinase [Clostridia bacterium]|nr:sensor histidine kinase [Clostridia bacterium]
MNKKGNSLYLVVMSCSFAVAGILLVFIAMTVIPRVSNMLEANAVDRTKDTVRQSAGGLEITVDNMLQTLGFIAGLLPDEAQIQLIEKSQQDIRAIAFFSEEGVLISATTPVEASPETVCTLDWFQKATEWQGTVAFFSKPHVQHIFAGQREWVISLSRSVDYTDDGISKTGVLLVDYGASAFASLIRGIQIGTSGFAYIIDGEDNILFHPRMELLDAGIAEELLHAVREQIVGVTRDIQDGRERILFINTIGQTRWRMVGVAYIDEVLTLRSAFLSTFMIMLICAGLLSIACAALVAYYVTHPIRFLQQKMRQVEEGNLHTTIAERGFREVRSLSHTFNMMLERIRSLMSQIVDEQEAKRFLELNALHQQINPHFLYNALDSIIWIQEQGRSQEAIEMICALARLFRISISKGRNIITVREEIEHVRNYLIIQKMRFKNTFSYQIDADESLLTLRTVKLVLQPLVENAVHHALDPYGHRTLHISIRIYGDGVTLFMSVEDDGIGIPAETLDCILDIPKGNGTGIGLRNVHERLQLTCGPGFGLTIRSVEDEGTVVTVCQPLTLEE